MLESETLSFDPACAEALRRLYNEPMHRGHDGQMYERDGTTRIGVGTGRALASAILTHGFKNTLETGFAYGFSTLSMLGALKQIPGAHHTALDPYEISLWKGIGLEKVKEAEAASHFTWMQASSLSGFGALAEAGKKFDFVFIDGNHLFDGVMLDIYGAEAVLEIGGVMAFDDLWMPAVRAAVAFIESNYFHYRRIPCADERIVMFQKHRYDDRAWYHFTPFTVPEEAGTWGEMGSPARHLGPAA